MTSRFTDSSVDARDVAFRVSAALHSVAQQLELRPLRNDKAVGASAKALEAAFSSFVNAVRAAK